MGKEAGWKMTSAQVRDALKGMSAKQYNPDSEDKHMTIWSAVFEPASNKVTYYFYENYDKGVEVAFGK